MGISLVSSGTVDYGGLAPTFGQSTTAGNLLIAWLNSNSGNATDPFVLSTGSGWFKAATGGANFGWSSIWYKPDCDAGETDPVWSASGGASQASMLAEFSGAATSSPVDQIGSGATGGPTETDTCTAADTAAGDLIVFCVNYNGGSGSTTIGVTMKDSDGNSVSPTTNDNPTDTTGWKYVFSWGLAGATLGASGDTATSQLGVFSGGGCILASFLASGGTSPTVDGSVSASALTAPTGVIGIAANGLVSPLALNALTGSATSNAVTLTGNVSALTFTAPPGAAGVPQTGGLLFLPRFPL